MRLGRSERIPIKKGAGRLGHLESDRRGFDRRGAGRERALLARRLDQQVDKSTISVGDVSDQRIRVVLDRRFGGIIRSLVAAIEATTAFDHGFSGRLHHVLKLRSRIGHSLGTRRKRACGVLCIRQRGGRACRRVPGNRARQGDHDSIVGEDRDERRLGRIEGADILKRDERGTGLFNSILSHGKRAVLDRSGCERMIDDASILRLYLNADDRRDGAPLYRSIVERAGSEGLAGASAFAVEVGFGAHHRIHDRSCEYSSYDIPITIEIVDSDTNIQSFLNKIEHLIAEGLAVVSRVRVIRYVAGDPGSAEANSDAPPRVRAFPDEDSRARAETTSQDIQEREIETMTLEGDAQRLTIYVGESDTWKGRNLAMAIVERCRSAGMAGATVERGVMGFGKRSVIHRAKPLGLSEDLPERIEVIDRADRISELIDLLDPMLGGGLVVVEDVHVVQYRHESQ